MSALMAGLVQCVIAWEVLYVALAWLRDGMDA